MFVHVLILAGASASQACMDWSGFGVHSQHNETHTLSDVGSACDADRLKLCPQANPFSAVRCVHEHHEELSKTCQAMLPHKGCNRHHMRDRTHDGWHNHHNMEMTDGVCAGVVCDGLGDGPCHCDPCKGCNTTNTISAVQLEQRQKAATLKMEQDRTKKHEEKEALIYGACETDISNLCDASTPFSVVYCLHNRSKIGQLSANCKSEIEHSPMHRLIPRPCRRHRHGFFMMVFWWITPASDAEELPEMNDPQNPQLNRFFGAMFGGAGANMSASDVASGCAGTVCDGLGDGPCHCDPCKSCTMGKHARSKKFKMVYLAALTALIPVALIAFYLFKKSKGTAPSTGQFDSGIPVAKRARSMSPQRVPVAVDLSHVDLSQLEKHLESTRKL